MKNRLLIAFLWCLFTASAFAQTAPSRFALQATVTDTLGAKLNGVTVMLQTAKDSVLTNYGRTDEAGKFSLKGVRRGTYILKITYVGMMPLNQTISLDTEPTVDLGTIKLKPIAKELYEVVVKAARAPLTIRGDTVEYDTRAFKVPPGSSVEDLLRKLPGVIVTAVEVTPRALLNQRIAESESHYRRLIEGSPVAMYVCDKNGGCRFVGDVFRGERQFGAGRRF
ncbi:MAG: hypothetical protein EOO39_13380, partial [Cytophagaceae bacterium]